MAKFVYSTLSASLIALATAMSPASAETLTIGIGTQDTTTNTVTSGVVIRELKLFEKYLPKTGKYANLEIKLDWQNFTSGPPVTNGMMADKLQIGAMGDFPLVVNGYTFQNNPDSHSALIAVSAYNINGSGNAILVNKDSPYYEFSDLKGKLVTVPFGSAAHGMVLKALQDRGLPDDYFQLASQAPEVGSTNLQEKKIDAHADFVPFGELLPYRGFARKIFDGAETKSPTWHGIVVRTDFAEKYPELVVAFLKAKIDADSWVRSNPKLAAEKIAEWTKTDKEVVYIFLGPGGIMTLDPTIKSSLLMAGQANVTVLQKLGRIKDFDVAKWVDDTYIRKAYAERGIDYNGQLTNYTNYEISGADPFCHKPITEPRKAGEIWVEDGPIVAYSSTVCTLGALADMKKKGQKAHVTYLFDGIAGIKLFADQAFFAIGKGSGAATDIVPFLLKKDAEAYAEKIGGKVGSFADAQSAVGG